MAESIDVTMNGRTNETSHRGLLSWLSPDIATYIYTVFLKPKWIRGIVQSIVRLFIPSQIRMKGVTICLNKQDSIVSGALALGCYESHLLDKFLELLRPGMFVVDIGANIGLYTVLSSSRVGSAGKVVAIEPERTNCTFIAKSLEANHFTNTTIHQKALSDKNGEITLFLCESNNADHRIYNATQGSTSLGRKSVQIPTARLDDILGDDRVKVDLIKMDIQGAEAIALEGMRNTLNGNPELKMVMEFWPWGLQQAGSDPIKLLKDIREIGFDIYEFDPKTSALVEVQDDNELAGRALERQHANLLLSRTRPS